MRACERREIDCRVRATGGRHRSAREPRSAAALTAPQRTLLDRLLAAYPLVVAYLVLLILYAWQTTRIPSPWIFTDELNWALLARGVAHTGHPQLREHGASAGSLYAYFHRAGLVGRGDGDRLRGGEVSERRDHDGDDLPGLRARAPLPRPPAVVRRGDRERDHSVARADRRADARVTRLLLGHAGRVSARTRGAAAARSRSIVLALAAVALSPFMREQLRVLVFAAAVDHRRVRGHRRARSCDVRELESCGAIPSIRALRRPGHRGRRSAHPPRLRVVRRHALRPPDVHVWPLGGRAR